MTKDERVIRYLDLASMPDHIKFDTSHFMKELDISNDDIDSYRQKIESELSLKPTEKRDFVVKQVIKPLLKKMALLPPGWIGIVQ